MTDYKDIRRSSLHLVGKLRLYTKPQRHLPRRARIEVGPAVNKREYLTLRLPGNSESLPCLAYAPRIPIRGLG